MQRQHVYRDQLSMVDILEVKRSATLAALSVNGVTELNHVLVKGDLTISNTVCAEKVGCIF
jgi:hypothetical protein